MNCPNRRLSVSVLILIASCGVRVDFAEAQFFGGRNPPSQAQDVFTYTNDASQRFLNACRSGDLETVRTLISQGVDPGLRYREPSQTHAISAIRIAAARNDVALGQLLIKHHVDIEVHHVGTQETPLHAAAENGSKEFTELLLKSGAKTEPMPNRIEMEKLNTSIDSYPTPLGVAIVRGHRDIAEVLLKHGANINAESRREPPLHHAISHGNIELVKWLLDQGADSKNAVSRAVRSNNEAIVDLLLTRGASIEGVKLHDIAISGMTKLAATVMAKGADVNEKNSIGETPLHKAARNGRTDMVKLLAENKGDIDALDADGRSVLWHAIKAYRRRVNQPELGETEVEKVVALLIQQRVSLDADRQNPLVVALSEGYPAVAKRLLDAGADFNLQNPVRSAIDGGHLEIANLLVQRGATLDLVTAAALGNIDQLQSRLRERPEIELRKAALASAVRYGHLPAVESLLESGTPVNFLYQQRSPLSLAPSREIAERLIIAGAEINWGDALHHACGRGDLETVKLLIALGVYINPKTLSAEQQFQIDLVAAYENANGVVENLVRFQKQSLPGLRQPIPAAQGSAKTPLDCAKESGNNELVNFLRQHGAKETIQK